MISLIGNRPALQIGRYQVIDYDTAWLDDSLRRAARAADHEDFPFVEDIRSGIVKYLETKCPLKLLQLDELYDRMRKMLVKIGCERIAEKLEPLAPPVTVSVVRAAMEAGNGYELAFFEMLRSELGDLRAAGAEQISFVGLRESAMILRGRSKWNKSCQNLLAEIEVFLRGWNRENPRSERQQLYCVEDD
ncbi:MAG: hypothetical protein H8M99_10120 [Gloeobacteraceae cyanobacterium ES-bin-144]|nr:hypothetical protein [Verrucomicrobiales bacterium]